MVGSVGGPQFNQPQSFDHDRDLRIRNVKHAIDTLSNGLGEVAEGVQNRAPRLIISGCKSIEQSASVVGKNVAALESKVQKSWKAVESDLDQLKEHSNSGAMAELEDTLDRLKGHLETFRGLL